MKSCNAGETGTACRQATEPQLLRRAQQAHDEISKPSVTAMRWPQLAAAHLAMVELCELAVDV